MADSFFGFDTSASNLNDDEGGGEGSEEEYDALNDETFGHGNDVFDWEVEHEHLAHQLESSRRHDGIDDLANSQLEASLSQLVLDETDTPRHTLGSSVWRHDPPPQPPKQLKNVCTVEEIERQLRQNQQPSNQNFFQPRFPVILQRPHGIQGPLPLPYPQQPMNQMNQPMNNIMNQNMGQMNHVNQMGQNINQMGQNVNQMGQNVNQMNQNVNQFMKNQMGFQSNHGPMMHQNQMMQNQIMNNVQNQIGPNVMNHMSHNVNHIQNNLSQNVNQHAPNVNQMGQNVNQMGPNANQMGQNMMNGGQFPMNQFPHMMNQNRMMGPPPGMNMPRQNFSPNMGQFNPNFRGPIPKLNEQSMMMNQQMMMKNQIPQNVPQNIPQNLPQNLPQNQSPQKSKDKQKNRVFNKTPNNMTNNLSSQGLVQLIQSTHPMLQPYNLSNSFHNANHHPMLHRTQLMNQTIMNQRNGIPNNRVLMNGEDSMSDTDEYAGLMTAREKQWLVNIQMLQLNTGTPYIHDFYYTVFLERQAKKEKEGMKEAHKVNQQNHPFYSGGVKQETMRRERHNSNRHNSTSEDPPRTYVPTQFENSLGKLQCGSVTAPRKIIDVEVVGGDQPQRTSRCPSVASTTNPQEVPRELKKTKQLLLDIEALYLILLRLEELNDPLAISNALILKEREEKQKQLELALALETSQEDETNVFLRNIESVQRKKQDSPKSEVVDKRQVVSLALPNKPAPVKNLLDEDKDDLMNKMFLGLLHSDRLAQMLTVRKGRSLIVRFVSRVPPSHGALRPLWSRLLRALPAAARRQHSGLTPLAVYYTKYIENSSGWTSILEACSLLAEALDPARTPHALSTGFTLSCVCALIEKVTTLVSASEATANERQWSKFLKTLARALKNTSLNVARPVQPLQPHKLNFHLKQIDSRGTIEILQRGKVQEFVDISKTDVHEQLMRYLC